ncbi:MAG: hypothetical protein IKP00_16595 [Victivallales bacterium]|nr:hypothetical protein [Victivallales bacterium]
MRHALPLLASILLFCACSRQAADGRNAAAEGNKGTRTENAMHNGKRTMRLSIDKAVFTATLEDNDTAWELVKRLPLRLEMTELNDNEKYASPGEPLPAKAVKVGRIEAGDVMLWGDDCLVVFYKSFFTPYSYTRIGRIVDAEGLAKAVGSGNVRIDFREAGK